MPPSSPVESQGDSPSLHFWWKIRRSEKPPADSQLSLEKTGGEKDKRQTGKKKPFPTKMATDGSCGSLWHLLLMDGCLQPFCALRTPPVITHRAGKPGLVPLPSTNRWAEWTDGVGHPGRPPLPRSLLPATSASLGGEPPATPPTVFAKDRRLEVDRPHGGRKRHMGAAQLCWPCWGQTCHTGTLGPPGGSCVQPPSRPSGPPLLADLIWKDTSLYAICPHPTPA